MKRFFLLACLIVVPLVFSLLSACGGGVGTCTCTCNCNTDSCIETGIGRNVVNELDGEYTESECESAADINGTNDCGEVDPHTTCNSSWDG